MFAVGRNSPSRGDRYVSWLADVVVDDVVDLFVGEQPGKGEGRTAEGKAGVDIDFLLRRAKSGAAKNVVDLLLPSAGHVAAPEGLSPSDGLDRAGQENTVLRPECICLDRPGRQRIRLKPNSASFFSGAPCTARSASRLASQATPAP